MRDGFLGRSAEDLDIVLPGNPIFVAREVAIALGGHFVLLDEARQMARVVIPSSFPGRIRAGPSVKEEGEEPGYLDFSLLDQDIIRDLSRRDFTIDAMALPLATFNGTLSRKDLVDPFGGFRDLKMALIRATGPEVFREDPLRLMRGVRLAAELTFTIEDRTQGYIESNASLLAQVSPERVRDEFCRILAVKNAAESLCLLDRLGLLDVVIPEMAGAKGVEQPKEHYWDVFDHSIETVAALERIFSFHLGKSSEGLGQKPGGSEGLAARDVSEVLALVPWNAALAEHFAGAIGSQKRTTILKLGAFLHDVAKPATKKVDSSGRIRFLGHAKEGAAIADDIMVRLRFSNRERELVRQIVEHHLRPGQWSAVGGQPPLSDRAIYRYFRDAGEGAIDTMFISLADHLAARGPLLITSEWEEHTKAVGYVINRYFQDEQVSKPPKLLSGHDVMAHFSLTPGPQVGRMLEAVKEAQAAGEVTTREEALAYLKAQF